MDEKTIALVQKIADSIGANKDFVIDAYARLYLVSAIYFCLFGVFIIFAGWFFVPKTNETLKKNDNELILPIAKWVLTIIGLLIIGRNLPDIFSPEGAAIFYLLGDLIPTN